MEDPPDGDHAHAEPAVEDVDQVGADVGEAAQAAAVGGRVVSSGARRRQRQAERRPHRFDAAVLG